jgi:lipopolysaccharide cholinephosphotransferase
MTEIDSFGEDIRGIKIDIFPIENTPNNKLIRIMKGYIADIFILAVASMRFYQNKKPLFKAVYMRTYKTKCYYYIRRFIGWIFSVFSKKYLYDKYDKFVSCNKGAKYRTIPTGRKYYHGEMHHESVFFPPVEALFEGIKVFIPHNTDAYLKRLYGDYMKIPSVEKRERHFYTEFSLDGAK